MVVGLNTNSLGSNQVYNNSSFNNVNQSLGFQNNFANPNSIFQTQNSKTQSFGGDFYKPLNPSFENDMLMPEELKGFGETSMANVIAPQTSSPESQALPQVQTQDQEKEVSGQKGDVEQGAQSEEEYVRQELEKKQADLKNALLKNDKSIAMTENGNYYRTTDFAKKSGAVLGFLAPMAGKIVELFKGGKFKELFKFSQLAKACPLVAVAGFAIGSMIDGYVNSQRKIEADAIS